MPRPQAYRYPPYSEFTRPIWLDIMQMMLRPFPTRNENGYADSDPPTTPTSSALLTAQTAQGNAVFNITAGKGAGYFAKMPVLIGDNAQDWQISTISSIDTDEITCNIPARKIWPIGTYFVPVWANKYHLSSWAQTWLAALLANAKIGDYDMCGRNILGTIGAITTFATEPVTNVANMPDGWVSVNSDYMTPATALVQASWANTTVSPVSRMGTGRGVQITTDADDVGGTGIQLAATIAVQAGQEYSLSALCKSNTSAGFTLQAYDVTNSAVIAETGTATGTAINSVQGATQVAKRFALNFAIPAKCKELQVRYLTTTHAAAARIGSIDDVILLPARAPIAFDQYVIPDTRPNPIVLFGDSWGAGTLADYFRTLMQTRHPGISVINRCQAGYNLDDLNGVFATQVAPLRPAVVVHYSGFQNDMTDAGTQSAKEGWIDQYIENCRSIGARPVFFGATPHVDAFSDGCVLNDYMRARCALHCR